MRALIVEHGRNNGALAAARALAAGGWTVGVAASRAGALSTASRCIERGHVVPSPEDDPEAFVDAVAGCVREHAYEVVFPIDETQLLALSAARDRLGATLPFPDHETLLRALDRQALNAIAIECGLHGPRTVEASDTALEGWAGDVVIKARRPLLLGVGAEGHRAETRIGPPAELMAYVRELAVSGAEAIAQEVIQGPLIAVSVLRAADGTTVARHQQAAEGLWPAGAGVSVRARTVAVDPGLAEGIDALLDRLCWIGLVQMQFVVAPGGAPHLIDFNPRFYGSLSLAVAAGVDYPVLWARQATGRTVGPQAPARVDVRYQWLGGDLRRAAVERHGGLVRDVAGSLRYAAGAQHAVWSARDPQPLLARIAGVAASRRQLAGERIRAVSADKATRER